MFTQYEREGLAAQHQAALLDEAAASRRAAPLGRRSARERAATALAALAAWLAPADQGAPARRVVKTGRSA
jgi:hypothetical protein